MQLRNEELVYLRKLLLPYMKSHNLKIGWMAAQNLHRVSAALEPMNSLLKPTPAMEAFDEERKPIIFKYAKKDSRGVPISSVDSDNPNITTYEIENVDELNRELQPISEKHLEAQKDREDLLEKEKFLLKVYVDFDPYTLSIEDTRVEKGADASVFSGETMLFLLHCGILKE